jgi:hypothetical protein
MPEDAKATDKYHYINFPNIPVPEDAYRLINTMDGMVKYQDKYKVSVEMKIYLKKNTKKDSYMFP